MISIEDVVSKARNIHNTVENDHIAAMLYLRRLIKSRQKKKDAKAADHGELEKTVKQVDGAEENVSKKRGATSPSDNSFRTKPTER